jgi:hypothetical protein
MEICWPVLARYNLKKLRLFGVRSEAELESTRFPLRTGPDLLPDTCMLEINPEKDDWEQWKVDDVA